VEIVCSFLSANLRWSSAGSISDKDFRGKIVDQYPPPFSSHLSHFIRNSSEDCYTEKFSPFE
jgi:hypothetical protein